MPGQSINSWNSGGTVAVIDRGQEFGAPAATEDCVTLWVGDSLGAVERACLRSFLRHGHKIALYHYREIAGVPEGVELRHASEILSEEAISASGCTRADLYSDWFRYELLRRGLGTWVDTDVYLLAPLDMSKPYLFGIEEAPLLNNAVLRVPAESPLLPRLLEPFLKRTTPRWLPWRIYWPIRLHELLTGKANLTKVPWGTTSPMALTALAQEFGLEHLAEPRERFYPVRWQQADWILDPGIAIEEVISEGTVAVHLWNRCIADFKNRPAPPGSFLDRLQREGR